MVPVLPVTEARTSEGTAGTPAGTLVVGGLVVVVVVGPGTFVPVVVVVAAWVVVVDRTDVVVVVDFGATVVVVGAAVVVGDELRLVPLPPPKSALKAASALGKSPLVMSLSCPPAVSLNEKMSVKATLFVATQLANWLMKYGSSPRPCPSL